MQSSSTALFSLGSVTCDQNARSALRQAGQMQIILLRRHLTGDFGDIPADQILINQQVMNNSNVGRSRKILIRHDDIESRYPLATGQTIVIYTHYVHTPTLRWTDICLAQDLVTGQGDDDAVDFSAEVALAVASDGDDEDAEDAS